MEISDQTKQTVRQWVEEGLSLSLLQKRLKEELNVPLTYLETRFLVDDLKLQLKEVERPAAVEPTVETALSSSALEQPPACPPSKVKVRMDSIALPHAMVSGNVTFSDGATASWYLDQSGHLGLDPSVPGYRPPEADIAEFQRELQRLLQNERI